MFKFLALLLKLTQFFAKREEAKQELRQRKFKRARAEQAKQFRLEEHRARAKADALASQAATANAESIIGSNDINEAQRQAGSLRAALAHVVK
ncbi:hypothetical protein FDH02_gp46 [Pseudomonas phage VSW-3]|uniref:Uncharacterized protein n=1 Tax=Pseudomonas phage VSW-3 TaxID=1852562 RepID=A0A173GCR9_9CAUD|nr:hypothetical protein FDH02_gp46 [Pseudomonas phage VSW-3]ANH51122.1 hypothetical protein VSW3_47 [Pseudomonas phage VSW-3]